MAKGLHLVHHPNLERQAQAMREDGFTYFPAILTPGEVAELRETMDRLKPVPEYSDTERHAGEGEFPTKVLNNAFNRDPLLLGFVDRPGVIDLVEEIHGNDAHVIGMTVWLTGPGRPPQTLHADWQPLTLPEEVLEDERVQIPVFISTMHYYLDDMYEELGPTHFVPGSHRAGRPPNGDTEFKGQGEHAIICNSGDGLLFRSEVWHRGTPNTSRQMRYLLQVHYAQRMITQKFPPYPHGFRFDEELLAQASPRQRRLLGDHKKSNYD
ncbi:MAG: phytanoyl-CoA dioxygenase family protein [Candidatus Latescibacterota bacterium]|nr:phytanoyl-CoA dioxygenase family protein [Candidatus Latescibacterota bacterium]